MSNTIIKVQNISKQYRLGNVGLGSLSHDINRWYQTTLRGKEDPYLKIGEANDRAKKGGSEYVWALRDINFEVKQGEVLGIIGRNGAGKSTLLKILSRTTTPTTGQIKIKGRVASLLEVGTGFHPELTGRENIFLNGAILGMTKREIKSKFDEIVDFAGVERYIDTPVKRYSSGMYVRLAFGVAAHLEPEILIVDEVLAVGDAEFQKKALGKMKDISQGQGRTVLFVSHNMTAIENLCARSLLLTEGKLNAEGKVQDVLHKYLNFGAGTEISDWITFIKGTFRVEIFNSENQITNKITVGSGLILKLKFDLIKNFIKPNIGVGINNKYGQRIVTYHTYFQLNGQLEIPKNGEISCVIPEIFLMPGQYFIEISLFEDLTTTIYNKHNVLTLNILESDFFKTGRLPNPLYQGAMVSRALWS